MDINEKVNNMNWKKIVVIALIIIAGFWMLREFLFFELIRTFKNTFSQFTTQFDQDQNRIHNIIEDNFKKHQAMQQEMDQKTKEFHNYVDQSFQKTYAYLNKDNKDTEKSANLQEILDKKSWEIVRRRYLEKTGKVLPSYEEFEQVFAIERNVSHD